MQWLRAKVWGLPGWAWLLIAGAITFVVVWWTRNKGASSSDNSSLQSGTSFTPTATVPTTLSPAYNYFYPPGDTSQIGNATGGENGYWWTRGRRGRHETSWHPGRGHGSHGRWDTSTSPTDSTTDPTSGSGTSPILSSPAPASQTEFADVPNTVPAPQTAEQAIQLATERIVDAVSSGVISIPALQATSAQNSAAQSQAPYVAGSTPQAGGNYTSTTAPAQRAYGGGLLA